MYNKKETPKSTPLTEPGVVGPPGAPPRDSPGFLQAPLGFQAFPNPPKSFQILPNPPKFSQILPNSPKFSQILPNSPKFCQILPNSAKFCQILPNFTKFCQILPNPPKCKGPSPLLLPFCKIFANLANLAPDLKLFAYLVDPKAKTYILNCKPPFEGGLGGRTLNPNKVKFGWAAWVKQRTQKRAFLTPTPPPDATGVGVRRAYTLYTP